MSKGLFSCALISICCLSALFFTLTAYAIDLPVTGKQISTYAGDDGDLQIGVSWPEPRFFDNVDGTVTDNLTGLMWTKSDSVVWTVSWQGALSHASSMNASKYLGFDDWRVPNINEIQSLMTFGSNIKGLPLDHPFAQAPTYGQWWSSTSEVRWPEYAWTCIEGSTLPRNKVGTFYHLWPVRTHGTGSIQLPKTGQVTCYDETGGSIACEGTGQDGDLQIGVSWPEPRFFDNVDGTVTDNLTGLMWTKNASARMTIEAGFNYINNMNLDVAGGFGFTGWRLPNTNELRSLIDYGNSNPALTYGHPFSGLLLDGSSDNYSHYTFSFYSSSTGREGVSYLQNWVGGVGTGMRYTSGGDGVWPVRSVNNYKHSPRIVKFSANNTYGVTPLNVSFDCDASDTDGYIESYSFDFGDGFTEPDLAAGIAYHTYSDAGTYQAICTATDNDGNSTISTPLQIEVSSYIPNDYILSVNVDPNAAGWVSGPSDIICPGNPSVCSASFAEGTPVTLEAYPSLGYSVEWSGCDELDQNTCRISMSGNRIVEAIFKQVVTPNNPPLADAGDDQTAVGESGIAVELNASESSDPEGQELTYSWTVINKPTGSTAELSNSMAIKPILKADTSGDYIIELEVNDGKLSSKDLITISYVSLDYSNPMELKFIDNTGDPIPQSYMEEPDDGYLFNITQAMDVETVIQEIKTQVTSYQRPMNRLVIVSHGNVNSLPFFGNGLTNGTIENFRKEFESLRPYFKEEFGEKSILLFACLIANSEEGKMLANKMALFTDACVYASTDYTGGDTWGDALINYTLLGLVTMKIFPPESLYALQDWSLEYKACPDQIINQVLPNVENNIDLVFPNGVGIQINGGNLRSEGSIYISNVTDYFLEQALDSEGWILESAIDVSFQGVELIDGTFIKIVFPYELPYALTLPGVAEQRLQIKYWDESLSPPQWSDSGIYDVSVNETDKTISFYTDHNSIFGILINDDLDNDSFGLMDGDCNDGDLSINPNAPEICDGIDNNCNDLIDEGLTFDLDNDGYTSTASCEGTADDCKDNDPNSYPGASEVCDGIDNNCNDQIDEDFPTGDACYVGIGECGAVGSQVCSDAGGVQCNAIPGLPTKETCDGLDNDCNGLTDEAGYLFNGFQEPINPDSSSIFKAGRTIPAKIALTDCSGSSVPDAQVSISIGKISNTVEGTVELLDVEASGNANTGTYFRYDPVTEQYIYNLSTKGLSTGTYRLSAHTDNSDAYSVDFSLK